MVLPIVIYPDDVLRQKAVSIKTPFESSIKELVFDMLETMDDNGNALGLAAPQVGKSLRLCIIKFEGKTHILINPQIKNKSWKKEVGEEGCLSFPGKFLAIKRSAKVTVTALDKDENPIEIKASGLLARALQHEIDHLNGILFIDRVDKKYRE